MLWITLNIFKKDSLDMQGYLVTLLTFILMTIVVGKIYILAWNKSYGQKITPAGFGVLLPIMLLIFSILNPEILANSILNFSIILFAGLIYLLDDLKGLNHLLRISIAFLFGAILFLIEGLSGNHSNLYLLALIIFFGVISVGLTNMMNFYDGADLNLASIVLITGIILFSYTTPENLTMKNVGIMMSAFGLGFGFFNIKPKTLYMGDAGSFVVALFFLYLIINFVTFKESVPLELIAVLTLPFFDVFYVMLIRVYFKHDMLSRNYLHLYQRIYLRYKRLYHLLPLLINVFSVIYIAKLIEMHSIEKIWALLIAGSLFTPIFYIICRFLFVDKSYFFGDGEKSEY
tara:strand:+ start:32289 stop:33323 length:1035 start_codon:yes stop_codon:yes gene_type:complete